MGYGRPSLTPYPHAPLHCPVHAVTLCNVTAGNTHPRSLTDLQQAILDVLWARTSATADEVREALEPGRVLKDSTVRTLLRRLEAQGVIAHRTEGKTFVYHATAPQRSVAARAVRQVIDRFCAGSVENFLLGMVEEKVVSAAEIARLARKVKQHK